MAAMLEANFGQLVPRDTSHHDAQFDAIPFAWTARVSGIRNAVCGH